MDDEEAKDVDGELSDEHLDGILDEELNEDEETEEGTTDEFGNPKEEEKGWE